MSRHPTGSAAVPSVSLAAILDLLASLAQVERRGARPWRLVVLFEGGATPWYVAACRARCVELGIDSSVRFVPRTQDLEELVGTSEDLESSVVLLKPSADRRRSRRGARTRSAVTPGTRAAAVARYRSLSVVAPARCSVDTVA